MTDMLLLKSADEVNPEKLARLLDNLNLKVSCISTGQIFASLGLYFTQEDLELRKKVLDVFSKLIYLAKDFGKIINIGRVRGFIAKGRTKEKAENLFIDMVNRLCDIADPLGVTIVVEPVNRYEINFINNLDEGSDLIKKVGYTNTGLMPDVFHMNIEDDNIGESIIRNGNLIKYIHFADSNRLAPGQGHINFDEVFNALKKIQFNGWASIEILPKPDPDTAALQAAKFIIPRIRNYNKLK
ncbi:MAG TPA: sugar phosphate isomerase/epimerase [Clostridiaceae bacterium]|nr:sugar phosphate isomerase/epimerase [Clostridiaceae bacterium]